MHTDIPTYTEVVCDRCDTILGAIPPEVPYPDPAPLCGPCQAIANDPTVPAYPCTECGTPTRIDEGDPVGDELFCSPCGDKFWAEYNQAMTAKPGPSFPLTF